MEASRIDAFAEAEALVDEFGARPPGSDAERRAAQHLARRLEELGQGGSSRGVLGVAAVGDRLCDQRGRRGRRWRARGVRGRARHRHRPARPDPHLPRRRRHHADHAAAARAAGVAERRLVRRAGACRARSSWSPTTTAVPPVPGRSGPCSSRWWSCSRAASPRVGGMSGVALTVVQFLATVVLIVYVALMLDIALSPTSQGESDNASGVGVVLRLAERLDRPRALRRPHRLHRRPEGPGSGHARLPPDPPQAVQARRDDRHQHRRRRRRRAPGDEEGGPAPHGRVAPAAHRQPRLRPVRQPRGERRLRRRVGRASRP